MNLRDVQYFAVIAEHRNLGRAAEALGLSPPALSMSLRRLERHMQAKLVKRTPKGVDLTAPGEAVLGHARRLKLSVEDIAREVTDLNEGRGGLVRVGAATRFTTDLLPATCAIFLKEAPRATLKVVLSSPDRGLPALSRGELELFVMNDAVSGYEDLAQERLFDEEWVVFASAHHRLARKKRVALADLVNERWVLGPSRAIREHLHRTFAQGNLPEPSIAAEINSELFRRELLPDGDLLSLGPRHSLEERVPRARLVELSVKELSIRRGIYLYYRRDAYLPPAARRFIEILKRTTKELAA